MRKKTDRPIAFSKFSAFETSNVECRPRRITKVELLRTEALKIKKQTQDRERNGHETRGS